MNIAPRRLGPMGRGSSRARTFIKYAFISSSSCSAVRGFSLAPRPLPPPLLEPRPPRPWPPLPLWRAQGGLRQPGVLIAVLNALLHYAVKEWDRCRGTSPAIEAPMGASGLAARTLRDACWCAEPEGLRVCRVALSQLIGFPRRAEIAMGARKDTTERLAAWAGLCKDAP